MKAKVILVTPTEEITVATVKSTIEAFQFAAMLQSLCTSSTHVYYVDHVMKGKGLRRTQPDSFRHTVSNCKTLYDALKPIYL